MTQIQIMRVLYFVARFLLPLLSKRSRYLLASDLAMKLHTMGWKICNPRQAWKFRLQRQQLRQGRYVIWA